jgi:hypothetical protein
VTKAWLLIDRYWVEDAEEYDDIVYREEDFYSETKADDSRSSRENGIMTRSMTGREEELEKQRKKEAHTERQKPCSCS